MCFYGCIWNIWQHISYLETPLFAFWMMCFVFLIIFLVFGKVHFRGPICHFFRADSWAPDNRAPGYFCYFFMMYVFVCNLRWYLNVWGGVHWILDGVIGILDGVFSILDGFLVLWTMNLIFWRLFHFWGWVFSDWDGVIGILDCDYVILDNYLLFEGENLVFLIVYLVF